MRKGDGRDEQDRRDRKEDEADPASHHLQHPSKKRLENPWAMIVSAAMTEADAPSRPRNVFRMPWSPSVSSGDRDPAFLQSRKASHAPVSAASVQTSVMSSSNVGPRPL